MEELAGLLAALPPAAWLRRSVAAYVLVNTLHILGIALLLGAILPLDLRLAGLIRGPALADLAPFLSRLAAAGLALAVLTGLLLLSVRPGEYLANPAFRAKLLLVLAALINIALVHAGRGWEALAAGAAPTGALRRGAAISAVLWLAVLLAGRLTGFL
ncbi:DUF2214 domain-containing protein [Paracoccus spongiarum]|uniref:DUF2214 domain-containing protein n=1 Tax=Paracoccus spongiarum TaxID=3064387 RepID=A0ABT9JIG7_9RHOB|nr:DUF2214 domain-containing protein [Paracoccus sp. 2205BS29-5]MDP5308836.1 DUF2214 domain-containing protein [Paracoccus sp. 2205BS29-5]